MKDYNGFEAIEFGNIRELPKKYADCFIVFVTPVSYGEAGYVHALVADLNLAECLIQWYIQYATRCGMSKIFLRVLNGATIQDEIYKNFYGFNMSVEENDFKQ